MEPSTIDSWAAYAKQNPLLTAFVAGGLVCSTALLVCLLFIGVLSGHIDDARFPGRLGAAIRIGKRIGVVFQGVGADVAVLLLGPRAPLEPPAAS